MPTEQLVAPSQERVLKKLASVPDHAVTADNSSEFYMDLLIGRIRQEFAQRTSKCDAQFQRFLDELQQRVSRQKSQLSGVGLR